MIVILLITAIAILLPDTICGSSSTVDSPDNVAVPHFKPSLSGSRGSTSGGIRLFDRTDEDSNAPSSSPSPPPSHSSVLGNTMEAANAMNSIAFLKELIGRKDNISDEVYFREEEDGGIAGNQMGRYRSVPPHPQLHGTSSDKRTRMTSTCEYTGKRTWFNRRGGGMRFRDTIRVCDGEVDGVAVECITRYKNKGNWVDCSKVICRFTIPPPTAGREDGAASMRKRSIVRMNMDSEVLLRAPLFGISGAVKESNIRTFGNAAEVFYKGIMNDAKR